MLLSACLAFMAASTAWAVPCSLPPGPKVESKSRPKPKRGRTATCEDIKDWRKRQPEVKRCLDRNRPFPILNYFQGKFLWNGVCLPNLYAPYAYTADFRTCDRIILNPECECDSKGAGGGSSGIGGGGGRSESRCPECGYGCDFKGRCLDSTGALPASERTSCPQCEFGCDASGACRDDPFAARQGQVPCRCPHGCDEFNNCKPEPAPRDPCPCAGGCDRYGNCLDTEPRAPAPKSAAAPAEPCPCPQGCDRYGNCLPEPPPPAPAPALEQLAPDSPAVEVPDEAATTQQPATRPPPNRPPACPLGQVLSGGGCVPMKLDKDAR